VRAKATSAVAPGKVGWWIVGAYVEERRSVASIAAALEKFPVHVDDAQRSCLLMQVIHVLSAEEQTVLNLCSSLASAKCAGLGFAAAGTRRRME
jgi:hypothetical protein